MKTAIVLALTLLVSAHMAAAEFVEKPLLADQESLLADEEFVYDLGGSAPRRMEAGGRQYAYDRVASRTLNLPNGGAQTLFRFAPCGFRTPHHHPRGTENFHVIEGEIRVNMMREFGGARSEQPVVNDVRAGYSGFFPLGHVHFLQNRGCYNATTISMFDTSDRGIVNVAGSLRLPRDTMTKVFGTDDISAEDTVIDTLLKQSEECLERCRNQ